MINPKSPTLQLAEKFTHELYIPERGVYKYDKVHSGQDFYGFRKRVHKKWIDAATFEALPEPVYAEYAGQRLELADEIIQSIDDQIVDTHLESVVKRIGPLDLALLDRLKTLGPCHRDKLVRELGKDARNTIVRCKSRLLIMPVPFKPHFYKYDLTSLGLEVLRVTPQEQATSTTTIHSKDSS